MRKFVMLMAMSLKKGFGTPNLPERVLKINSILIVRIFRFLGVLSVVIQGWNYNSKYLGKYSIGILLILTSISFIYETWIVYERIKHMRKVLKSDELDIRK